MAHESGKNALHHRAKLVDPDLALSAGGIQSTIEQENTTNDNHELG